jgi:hypothetical protein
VKIKIDEKVIAGTTHCEIEFQVFKMMQKVTGEILKYSNNNKYNYVRKGDK